MAIAGDHLSRRSAWRNLGRTALDVLSDLVIIVRQRTERILQVGLPRCIGQLLSMLGFVPIVGRSRLPPPKVERVLQLADIPACTSGEVRPASHVLEYFDPPESRRTVCRCPSVWLHFADSPLEEDGFELSVPREIGYGFGGFGPFSGAFGSPVGRDPSPKGTHPLATRTLKVRIHLPPAESRTNVQPAAQSSQSS